MSDHSHYFKDVSKLQMIDVYRVSTLFGVTDPCIQHAIKKLLVPGGRGAGKDIERDVQEAIDSLERWKAMRKEDAGSIPPTLPVPVPANISGMIEEEGKVYLKKKWANSELRNVYGWDGLTDIKNFDFYGNLLGIGDPLRRDLSL